MCMVAAVFPHAPNLTSGFPFFPEPNQLHPARTNMAKKGKQNGAERQHAPAVTDPRFARLQTDPRFLKPRRDDTKVVVDSRFKDIFASDGGKNKSRKGAATQGKGKARVDKYGRKLAPDASASELKRFYRLEDEADEKDGDLDARVASASSASGSDSGSGVDSDEDEGATKAGEKGFIDYARGEGDLESSGDEGLDSDEEEDSEEEDEGETDSDEEDGDVVLGPSHVVRREKQRRAAKEDDEDEFGEIDLDEDVDESAYAELDAQAAAAIRQGEAEDAGESSDEDLDVEAMQAAAVARGKAKGKEKASNKPRKQTMPRGDDTPRLAVVNMDWDHVRAKDLYKVFTSLVSPTAARLPGPAASVADSTGASSSRRPARQGGAAAQVRGSLLHVRVYPSDFGKERMEREDREGPPRDIFKKGSRRMRNGNSALVSEDEESEEEINEKTIVQVDEGGEFDEEALRKYQLERLR